MPGVADLELRSKIAICLITAFFILFPAPILIDSLTSQPVLLALFVGEYGSLLFFLPRTIRGYGADQEKSIAEFLRVPRQADDDLSSAWAERED